MGSKRQHIPNKSSKPPSNIHIQNVSKGKLKTIGKDHHWSVSTYFFLFGLPPFLAYAGFSLYAYYESKLIVRPFHGENVILENDTINKNIWGTYRPNLYFGVKAKKIGSPVFGLMWMPQFLQDKAPPIRHWCEQNDKLPKYGWIMHDGETFGRQEIVDKWFTVITDFMQIGEEESSGWSAKIKIVPKVGFENISSSIFFYSSLVENGEILSKLDKKNQLISIIGQTSSVGKFSLNFKHSQTVGSKVKQNYLETFTPSIHLLKEIMMNGFQLKRYSKNSDSKYFGLSGIMIPEKFKNYAKNFIVKQYTFKTQFEFQVDFITKIEINLETIKFDPLFNNKIGKFEKEFEMKFGLSKKNFNKNEIKFAQAISSNLLGGVGYFYGSSLVKSRYLTKDDPPLEYWPSPLLTAVPSRSFFPRGFLWDEGFHNLLISRCNPVLSREIIGHWLDLLNTKGWIPREQILGAEARSKVPDEFVVQHDENANPPTLFLPIEYMINKDLLDEPFLKRLFPRLKKWYDWFNTTQTGQLPGSYRWRGRDPDTKYEINPKTLTSGLDDYPRASHPTEYERHLDLRCWMYLASSALAKIAEKIGQDSDSFKKTRDYLADENLLNELHWNNNTKQYSDYGLHSNKVVLIRPKPKKPMPGVQLQKERHTRTEPKKGFVNVFGYVSLFPLFMKILLPNSEKLSMILDNLKDEKLLWTKFGLRSLARNSPLYNTHNTEHDPPYWRGSIWINMNYMAVSGLNYYAKVNGPYQEKSKQLYSELRNNLIKNIYEQYERTGYIWENYDDMTGNGKGSHPFTGWTSLVVNLMAELY